ncbi:MAG: hypothetical protein ACOCWD_03750 [Tangfeifania sp.]
MEKRESVFSSFPNEEELLRWYQNYQDKKIPDINGHIHTPHSFSAFESIEQAFDLAKSEGVTVLGINDFYTTDGYDEFAGWAEKKKVFPFFNIEFMTLQHDLQEQGVRVNDPNNPGRTYFSGKGLRQPAQMSNQSAKKIENLIAQSNRQTFEMVGKLNEFFNEQNIPIQFDPEELQRRLAKNIFRERHIAQAVRIAVFEKAETDLERAKLLNAIFQGKEIKSAIDDVAGLENEIRGNLLKSGGPAFVPEDSSAFLSLEEAMEIITDAGGIPCYPVLLDDAKGNFTDFEADKEKLLKTFLDKDIYAIELIPGRNDCRILKNFVKYFHENGFIISFGTEHNTPKLDPMKISCRGGVDLDEELKQINYQGAAVIAAHQYCLAKGMMGWLEGHKAKVSEKEKFIELGKAVIAYFQKS